LSDSVDVAADPGGGDGGLDGGLDAGLDAGGALAAFEAAYASAKSPGACTSNPSEDFTRADTRALMALAPFYSGPNGNFYTGSSAGWWTSANAVEAAADSIETIQGLSFEYLLKETFDKNLSAQSGHYLNDYYDDEGWWANAWVRAYDLTGDSTYLATAESIFQDMTTGWDSTCGGGLWWSKARTYKNAIPNELFLLLAARLHNRTPRDGGQDPYLTWAQREWAWFNGSGMINAKGLVNDGLTSACQNNGGQTWTYNQGVILGGLAELFRATGDASLLVTAERIANAATSSLVTADGILQEPCAATCSGDSVQFKGPFTRYLAQLLDLDGKPAYREFLVRNARSIWSHDRSPSDDFGLLWSGPFDSADFVRQNSAMVTPNALAEEQTQDAPFAETATSPRFCHPLGAAVDGGWACTDGSCPAPGFLMNGPYLSSLAAGVHTVHVRLSVDVSSPLPLPLARVDIYDPSSAKVLAKSPALLWSDFTLPGVGHDVALSFSAKPDTPVEFRVFWGAPEGGPALEVHDVLVDAMGGVASALGHGLGRPDGKGRWEADSARDPAAGALVSGPILDGLPAASTAWFELKAEPPLNDSVTLATLSVTDLTTSADAGTVRVARSAFKDARYHTFPVAFTAIQGHVYSPTATWEASASPQRLTARAVYLRPSTQDTHVPLSFNSRGIGTAPGDANIDGEGYGIMAAVIGTSVKWRDHTFTLGPTTSGASNVLQGGASVSVTLPKAPARMAHLLLLAVKGAQSGAFSVHYTDGTSTSFNVTLPDWFAEVVPSGVDFAFGMATRWSSSGVDYGNMHVDHLELPLDPSKSVASLSLPNNTDVKVLALTLSQTD
jgi:predicted alpha-1,6-mannanase (GH76 family)